MLLVHQAGAVKVGEVVRYTLTYTPARDRILPTPAALRVKVRNTSAVALRAAYLHGPYALYAACHPAAFDPWKNTPESAGKPQFEPNLKAGGSWSAQLAVPEEIRETSPAADGRRRGSHGGADGLAPSVTWTIEVSSQILFSPTAAVHYEIVVGRDEKSLDFGFAGLVGGPDSLPGQLADHLDGKKKGHTGAQPKGVFSTAIRLKVEDTASLWDKPALPAGDEDAETTRQETRKRDKQDTFAKVPSDAKREQLDRPSQNAQPNKRQKRIHLVILTHGLHGNLGSDMLYMKEAIDAAAKQAKMDRKMRTAQARQRKGPEDVNGKNGERHEPSESAMEPETSQDEEDDEDIIVRGYDSNVCRTERGIQYLGKRLAKHVLSFTYPDQPYYPTKQSVGKSISKALGSPDPRTPSTPAHANSSVVKTDDRPSNAPYKITSISFIGHSLGGLVQTYAIAYIQKHSPEFFDLIRPINFVALASPFLGLSNENPLYVKFALDFGLVGRTGQDLGLTWRAPTIARSGWGAMIAGLGTEGQKQRRQPDPSGKPILRILPTGPAHHVLRRFRNRTVYSNVVNDGVVPLRTSCLLFLDWRGLGRVEKARRENGLVGTMAGWGWAEITGANATEQQKALGKRFSDNDSFGNSSGDEGTNTPNTTGAGERVPQPSQNATQDEGGVAEPDSPEAHQFLSPTGKRFEDEQYDADRSKQASPAARPASPLAGLINFFKPSGAGSKSHHHQPKQNKIYSRGQTIKIQPADGAGEQTIAVQEPTEPRPGMARGDSALEEGSVYAPPKTTIFESATDILKPPIPSEEYLTDPSSRPRTIFHDRVYHPDDIPAPPVRRRTGILRAKSSDGQEGSRASTFSSRDSASASASTLSSANVATPVTPHQPNSVPEEGTMKVEEKIARAYHRELSWRKVLVRLEPDAHNNMVVRRMFANAYGWPVIKHLVDTHFADSYTASTADSQEPNMERARPMELPVDGEGQEVVERPKKRSSSADGAGKATRVSGGEEQDGVGDLASPTADGGRGREKPRLSHMDSAMWDDRFFDTDDEDDDLDEFEPPRSPRAPEPRHTKDVSKDRPAKSLASTKGKDKPHVDIVTPIVAPTLVQSPGGAGTIGLRKSLEEQLDTAKKSESNVDDGGQKQGMEEARPSNSKVD